MAKKGDLSKIARELVRIAYSPAENKATETEPGWDYTVSPFWDISPADREELRARNKEVARRTREREATTLVPEMVQHLFHLLARGDRVTLHLDKVHVQLAGNTLKVERELGRFADKQLWDVLQVFGDRLTRCPICGNLFFRFGRAQYCSTTCSAKGRRERYRTKRRAAKPPTTQRLRSRVVRRLPLTEDEIATLMIEVEEYLHKRRAFTRLNDNEGRAAVVMAKMAIRRALERGKHIKHIKAYAMRVFLQRAARVYGTIP
jgi:hypothetical protein